MAQPNRPTVSTWEGPVATSGGQSQRGRPGGAAPEGIATGEGGPAGGGGGGGGGFGGGAQPDPATRPRVVLRFPANASEMLLSGTLAGGEALANRAQVVDAPIGQGHVVMFAIRPFWRWQTQGTYMLGFNTILNWNDLNAGRTAPSVPPVRAAEQR